MFGFTDKETPEAARVLFLRAQDVSRRYMSLPRDEIARIVERDFPPERRWVSHDQITFGFDDLPDFNFGIMWALEEPMLTIFGGGRYDGIMLQRPSYDAWHVDLTKPYTRPLGPKAKRLAEVLMHQYGATNPRATVERLLGRP